MTRAIDWFDKSNGSSRQCYTHLVWLLYLTISMYFNKGRMLIDKETEPMAIMFIDSQKEQEKTILALELADTQQPPFSVHPTDNLEHAATPIETAEDMFLEEEVENGEG